MTDNDWGWVLTIRVAQRSDGGMLVWSDELPGLVLSGADPAKVGADIFPAIKELRQHNRNIERCDDFVTTVQRVIDGLEN